MKNLLKLVSKLCLVSTLILLLNPGTVSANELDEVDVLEAEVSESFVNYYTSAFSNYDKVTVLDLDGNDITEKFYLDNIKCYNDNDFLSIKNYAIDNIGEICIDEISIPDKQSLMQSRAPFVSCPVSKRYFKVLNKNQAVGEIEYYLQGSFVWDRATGKITSVGVAVIRIPICRFGSGWSVDYSPIYTNSYANASKTNATFTGQFKVTATYNYMFVPVFRETFSFSDTISASPFG